MTSEVFFGHSDVVSVSSGTISVVVVVVGAGPMFSSSLLLSALDVVEIK